MNKKKILTLLSASVLCLALTVTTASATNTEMNIGAVKGVNIKGTELMIPEGMGYFWMDANNRVMVPVNILSQTLGYTNVTWDGAAQKVTITGGPRGTIVIPVNEKYITVGTEQIALDTNAVNIDGRIYVPIRAVGEALEFTVNWTDGIVYITDHSGQPAVITGVADKSLTECVNFQAAVAASGYSDATFQREVWEVRYTDPNGAFEDFSVRYSGNRKYGVDGLSFGENGAKQLQLTFAMIRDVVEPNAVEPIINKLKERDQILSAGWTKAAGYSLEAKQYIVNNSNQTFNFGNVNFTFGQDTSQFTITPVQ